MTITVPKSVKREMHKYNEVNWSAVASKAFQRRLQAEKILKQFSEPGLSDEEAIQRGLRVEKKVAAQVT